MKKIKYILSDMDGVLIDAKDWHYDALNMALQECGYKPINREEHLTIFDGLSTSQKLNKLYEMGRVKKEDFFKINELKQYYTWQIGKERIEPMQRHMEAFSKLKDEGYKIVVCSNSIRKTVDLFIEKANLTQYTEFLLSNEDIKRKKPYPDIYLEAMKKLNAQPEECLILEDNFNGIKAAKSSGAHLLKIDTILDVNYINIKRKINQIEGNMSINIVIPMAGAGSRFVKAGYTDPKPFINIDGKTMIERVLENLYYPDARYILIARKEHLEARLDLAAKIKEKYNVEFITVDKLTEGTVCTVLHARKLINNDTPMVIANSDQIIDIKFEDFVNDCLNRKLDGSILTFLDKENNPKWSFAKTDEYGFVTETKEKQLISNRATVGIYMWAKGSDFVDSAIDMIAKNYRVNNEFYTCPTYNYLIEYGKKIGVYDIDFDQMHGVGTPEDLNIYLEILKNKNESK